MDHRKKQVFAFLFIAAATFSATQQKRESSYSPVIEEPFEKVMAQHKSQKPAVMKRYMDLLNERYDLSKKVTTEVMMSKKKDLTAFLRQL